MKFSPLHLLGLIAALNVVGLSDVVDPLNGMVREFLHFLPSVVGAALIFFVGFVLATVVRRMVEATVEAVELDRRLIDAGLTHTPKGPGLARLLGLLAFTLIIIPVSIAALQALNITAISDPATRMLADILATIPKVIGAALIIFIAYLIGRWIMTLTEEGLKSIGFDAIISSIANAEPIRVGREKMDLTPGVDTIDFSKFPPSRMIGLAVLIGIVLFASVEAANMLGFTAMSDTLRNVVGGAGNLLLGAIIIALGVLLANILAAATQRSDKPSSEIMSVLVRWGVIALATAMGLTQMNVGSQIIVLSFGLILGSVTVSIHGRPGHCSRAPSSRASPSSWIARSRTTPPRSMITAMSAAAASKRAALSASSAPIVAWGELNAFTSDAILRLSRLDHPSVPCPPWFRLSPCGPAA